MFNMVRGAARPSSIVLALVAMLPLAAQAADSPVAWATTQITGLQYLLVDLDPTDGLAPSATFNGAAYLIASENTDLETAPRYNGSLLPASTLSATGPYTSVQASPDGLSTSVTLSASDVVARLDSGLSNGSVSNTARIEFSGPNGYDPDASWSISLGAKTALYISGRASIEGQTDQEQLDAALSLIETDWYHVPEVATNIWVRLAALEHTQNPDEGTTLYQGSESTFNFGSLDEQTSFKSALPFGVHFANFDQAAKDIVFELGVQSWAGVSSTQAIPEPSTWALLAGGLISLGLVRRRQRR